MKLYEALTVLSRKGKGWFCYRNEDNNMWNSVFKFSEDKKEVYETSLHYALTDSYWRKTTGNGWDQGMFNVRLCEYEFECTNDIVDLWKIYFKDRAEILDSCEQYIKQCTRRLKCALRKKVIDRAMYNKLDELMSKVKEEVDANR